MNVPDGMEVKQVKGGTFAKIHYTADPDKRDPEWIEREKAVTTPRFWRVQMEMDDTLHEGEPVWLEWKDQLHCLETLTKGKFTEFPIHEQSLFWGGWDCVAGGTLIDLPEGGSMTIAELHELGGSFDVWSLSGSTVRVSKASSMKRPPRQLFRVCLSDGSEIRATSGHLLLTRAGWRALHLLSEGYEIVGRSAISLELPSCAGFHPRSNLAPSPSWSPSNALRWMQTVPDSQVNCWMGRRRHDARPHFSEAAYRSVIPLQFGALGLALDDQPAGDPAFVSGCTRAYRQFDRLSSGGSYEGGPSLGVEEGPSEPLSSKQTFRGRRFLWRYRGLNEYRLPVPESEPLGPSFLPSSYIPSSHDTFLKIVSIEPDGIEEYYDLQVPGDNCYLAGGIWHHNCGNTLWPAFCLAQQTPAGQIFGMCEVTPTAPMSMALFAPIVKRFLETNYSRVGSIRHVGDESGAAQQGAYGDSAFKVAAKSGFRIMAVPNAWTERQEAVSWGLIDMIDESTPRMIISATKCPVLVAGFRGAYQVKTVSVGAEEGPGAVYARPVKDGYSHCVAEGSLVTTNRGDIPIELVDVGDLAMTRNGWRRVLKRVKVSDSEETIELKFSNGNRLIVTAEHLVGCPGGWSRADTMKYGKIAVCLEKRSLSTKSSSTDTRKAKGCQIAGTSRVTREGERSTSTVTFGKRLMARYLLAIMSIIGMVTPSITASRTWSAFLLRIILAGTDPTQNPCELVGPGRSRLRSRLPLRGTKAQRESLGTEITPGECTSGGFHDRLPVKCAGLSSRASEWPRLGSAPVGASRSGEGALGLMILPASAQSAVRRSARIDTPKPGLALASVVESRSAGRRPVYDLEIEGEHEFFASGVLVHNCQDAWQYLMVVIRRELLRAKREPQVIFDHEEREKERVRRQLGFR